MYSYISDMSVIALMAMVWHVNGVAMLDFEAR
jgi:hypothetical protein